MLPRPILLSVHLAIFLTTPQVAKIKANFSFRFSSGVLAYLLINIFNI
jgi:hypothetical protein